MPQKIIVFTKFLFLVDDNNYKHGKKTRGGKEENPGRYTGKRKGKKDEKEIKNKVKRK